MDVNWVTQILPWAALLVGGGGIGGFASYKLSSKRQNAMLGPEREALITEAAARATTALSESLEALRRENEGLRVERSALLERIATLEGQVEVLREQIAQSSEASAREGMLGAILAASPDAVIVVNSSGVIEFANVAATKMFVWPPGTLEGLPLYELIPERFRAAHRNHKRDYLAEPHVRPMGLEHSVFGRRSDGSEFPVEIGLAPLERPGHKVAVVAVVRDMTERYAAKPPNFGRRATDRDPEV